MRIIKLKPSQKKKIISTICNALQRGALVVIPSDTVYGLAADATNQKAVDALLQFKKRPPGKAISVFVENLSHAQHFVSIDKNRQQMLRRLLPGPFTIVLPYKGGLARGLASEKNTLGIRLPNFPFIKELLMQYGKPLTATSANVSGDSPHYAIDPLLATLSDKKQRLIDLMVDAGKLPLNKLSTVIDITSSKVRILRRGDIQGGKKIHFTSHTPSQTKKIGALILHQYLHVTSRKPLIFLIEGALGVGKTIFVKGIGESLGITHMVSPTFVIYYEYAIKKNTVSKMYHCDLYAIEEENEFYYLQIDQMLKPHTVICIEWGEKSAFFLDQLSKKGVVIRIRISYDTQTQRNIEIIKHLNH